MGWFAGGQAAELVAPGDWDRIRAVMGPLDYPGTVFGVGASDAGSMMPDVARRYARALALQPGSHSPRRAPRALLRAPALAGRHEPARSAAGR
jgi:gamma-carbonic anhydrase